MTDNDDFILDQFFQAARAEQIPDNGFSRRVMERLPERQYQLSRVWTWACIVMALVVFTFIGGWQQLAAGIVRVLSSGCSPMQLLQLMACGAVLTTLVATELIHRERVLLY